MLKNSINMGTKALTLRNDPRITPLGKYLRITKINELPQIINVLLGDLSLVGPRPLIVSSFRKYPPAVQEKIYLVKPGITGIGSIVFRDEEKLASTIKKMGYNPSDYYLKYIFPYKGALELWYQDHISFGTDLKILLLTFWQIVFPKSELTFRVFNNLPARQQALTLKGLETVAPESLGLLPLPKDAAAAVSK